MDAPIRPAGRYVPPDTQTPTLRELDRLERELARLKAMAEGIQPIYNMAVFKYNRVLGDITMLENQIASLRQGQLLLEI